MFRETAAVAATKATAKGQQSSCRFRPFTAHGGFYGTAVAGSDWIQLGNVSSVLKEWWSYGVIPSVRSFTHTAILMFFPASASDSGVSLPHRLIYLFIRDEVL